MAEWETLLWALLAETLSLCMSISDGHLCNVYRIPNKELNILIRMLMNGGDTVVGCALVEGRKIQLRWCRVWGGGESEESECDDMLCGAGLGRNGRIKK